MHEDSLQNGDPDEGGYVVSLPDVPGCISEGETIEPVIKTPQMLRKCGLKLLRKTVM